MIDLSSLKVLTVNPGSVVPYDMGSDTPWKYTIIVSMPDSQRTYYSEERFSRATDAEQAMREEVHRLKRVHYV